LSSDEFVRDHHPRCSDYFLAGGGIQAGFSIGATDEFGCNIAERPIHVNDLHATNPHCLGIDHLKLVYRHAGHDFHLTLAGEVVPEIV
jgi:hypothetical protein